MKEVLEYSDGGGDRERDEARRRRLKVIGLVVVDGVITVVVIVAMVILHGVKSEFNWRLPTVLLILWGGAQLKLAADIYRLYRPAVAKERPLEKHPRRNLWLTILGVEAIVSGLAGAMIYFGAEELGFLRSLGIYFWCALQVVIVLSAYAALQAIKVREMLERAMAEGKERAAEK